MLSLVRQLTPLWQRAVLSALMGDALGVSYEFKNAAKVPMMPQMNMVMPADYDKSHARVPYGTWSDDGSQLLALLDSLLVHKGSYVEKDFSERLLSWYSHGLYQAGGEVFDVGLQTSKALEHWALTQEYLTPKNPNFCGNGSLMRALPVASLPDIFGISRTAAVRIAAQQSLITHAQPIGQLCCALYMEFCWHIADGLPLTRQTWLEVCNRLADRGALTDDMIDLMPAVAKAGATMMPMGSGYVLSTLYTAVWAVAGASSIPEAIRRACSLGDDTDTVACVAGGLAGLAFPLDSLSRKWLGEMTLTAKRLDAVFYPDPPKVTW